MLDLAATDDLVAAVRELTDGRGPDAVIDAVGMEAHGTPAAKVAQKFKGLLPDRIAEKLITKAGVDRLAALHTAIELVRRGGTISIIGVYGGMADPMPKLTLRQADPAAHGPGHVKRWVDHVLPLVIDDADPLGTEDFATHRLPLEQAPDAYANFQAKKDGAIKICSSPDRGVSGWRPSCTGGPTAGRRWRGAG